MEMGFVCKISLVYVSYHSNAWLLLETPVDRNVTVAQNIHQVSLRAVFCHNNHIWHFNADFKECTNVWMI